MFTISVKYEWFWGIWVKTCPRSCIWTVENRCQAGVPIPQLVWGDASEIIQQNENILVGQIRNGSGDKSVPKPQCWKVGLALYLRDNKGDWR